MFERPCHFGAPAVSLGPWRLEVRGLVERPLKLSLADLAGVRLDLRVDITTSRSQVSGELVSISGASGEGNVSDRN